MQRRSSASVLVVDGDLQFADELGRSVASVNACALRCVPSVDAGIQCLSSKPALVITEARLPDGDALRLVHAARKMTSPPIVIVVSHGAGGRLVALLLQEGADAYFDKPVCSVELSRTYEALSDPEEQCRRMARLLVGRIGLKEAQLCLRGTMHVEALVRTGGSRRAAANLLQVDRRYVQRMAEDHDEPAPKGAI
jgi:DNA-binding NtrC family response regulator